MIYWLPSTEYFLHQNTKAGPLPIGTLLSFYCIRLMQDDTPKVVAIAVRIVIAMWRILLQKFLFSISWKVKG